MRISLRSWATPLTIAAFFLMSATGVLMFFELELGLMTVIHQWFSWLFLIGAGGHVAANFRPFKNHFKSAWGQVSMAGFVLVLAASAFSWGAITGPQLERPIEEALVDAPISALAQVTRTDLTTLLSRLKMQGVDAADHQSIRELSGEHGVGENRLLGLVFLPDAGGAASAAQ